MYVCYVIIYVTGFLNRGLPHTSKFLRSKNHSFMIKQDTSLKLLHFLSYFSALNCANCNSITLTNLKL